MTLTPFGPELNRLSALWSAQPTSTCFAALADALRKRGALEQATAVATAGVAARPEYLPGRLVMSRIYRDQGQGEAAEAELRAALALDATHPVVLEDLAVIAGGTSVSDPTPESAPVESTVIETPAIPDATSATDYYEVEPDEHDADPPHAEPVLTESLAMLYRGQGHLEQAVDVLDALVVRAPGNASLVARRNALRAELELTRPRPYDAVRSGGRPVRDWLSSLAASHAAPPPPASGFDAFYQTAGPAPTETGDLEAFQAWLRELDR